MPDPTQPPENPRLLYGAPWSDISLRDLFALAALAGMYANQGRTGTLPTALVMERARAEEAYRIADVMLVSRRTSGTGTDRVSSKAGGTTP